MSEIVFFSLFVHIVIRINAYHIVHILNIPIVSLLRWTWTGVFICIFQFHSLFRQMQIELNANSLIQSQSIHVDGELCKNFLLANCIALHNIYLRFHWVVVNFYQSESECEETKIKYIFYCTWIVCEVEDNNFFFLMNEWHLYDSQSEGL